MLKSLAVFFSLLFAVTTAFADFPGLKIINHHPNAIVYLFLQGQQATQGIGPGQTLLLPPDVVEHDCGQPTCNGYLTLAVPPYKIAKISFDTAAGWNEIYVLDHDFKIDFSKWLITIN